MMKVSTRGRYALRLMIDLAHHRNEGYVSLKEISARQDITVRYLEQIIAILLKAGFVTLPFWRGLQQVIENYLRRVTLEDLAEQQKEIGCDYGAGI